MYVYLNADNKAIMQDGDHTVEVTKIWFEKAKNKYWYILPENSVNRKYLGVEALKAAGKIDCGNTPKVARILGSNTNDRKPHVVAQWLDYLTDEEKAIVDSIKAKAIERAKAATLKAQIAEMQAKLDALENN